MNISIKKFFFALILSLVYKSVSVVNRRKKLATTTKKIFFEEKKKLFGKGKSKRK